MNKKRWCTAIEVLKDELELQRAKKGTVKVDMATWAAKTDCGTVACAAGICAMSSRLRGLRLEEWPDAEPVYMEHDAFWALEKYFGIDMRTSMYVFDCWEYPDSKHTGIPALREVIKRMEKVLADCESGVTA